MSTKFKVGDKVRHVAQSVGIYDIDTFMSLGGAKVGDVFTVQSVTGSHLYLAGCSLPWNEKRFELVPPAAEAKPEPVLAWRAIDGGDPDDAFLEVPGGTFYSLCGETRFIPAPVA